MKDKGEDFLGSKETQRDAFDATLTTTTHIRATRVNYRAELIS